jgi:hypothetical protein
MATFEQLLAVKRRHSPELMRQDGVCGLDVETDAQGASVIAVHVDTDDPKVLERLPSDIEGHPIKVVHTGPIRKQARGDA